MEVVLVDRRPSEQSLRTKYQVEGLAQGRLADDVTSDQQGVTVKVDLAGLHAAEV